MSASSTDKSQVPKCLTAYSMSFIINPIKSLLKHFAKTQRLCSQSCGYNKPQSRSDVIMLLPRVLEFPCHIRISLLVCTPNAAPQVICARTASTSGHDSASYRWLIIQIDLKWRPCARIRYVSQIKFLSLATFAIIDLWIPTQLAPTASHLATLIRTLTCISPWTTQHTSPIYFSVIFTPLTGSKARGISVWKIPHAKHYRLSESSWAPWQCFGFY